MSEVLKIEYEIVKEYLTPTPKIIEDFHNIVFSKEDMESSYKDKSPIGQETINYLNSHYSKSKVIVKDIWAQKYNNGFHSAHHHHSLPPKHIFSFVWYTEVEEGCSEIVFYNPGWPYINTHEFRIKPQNGLLITFPSFIVHEVLFNKDKKRNVIAGNLTWLK